MDTAGSGLLTGRTIADIGERGLINRIRAKSPAPPAWLAVGIGDDAAVIEPPRGELDVLTSDALVEGVHFDLRFVSAGDVGHKSLAVNLSDLAAMGASPRAALLSLALPPAFPLEAFDALVDGFAELAASARVTLVGGNITRSPGPLVVDVTLMGSVRRRRALTRAAARPGDSIFVSGSLGASAAGLAWLQADHLRARAAGEQTDEMASAAARYRRPAARLKLGLALGRNRAASACIDLSDGLADGLRQIAQASGVRMAVDAAALPVDPGARRWFDSQGVDPLTAAIEGGEDYELLFTVSRRRHGALRAARRVAGPVPFTRVGVVEAGSGVSLIREGREEPIGGGYAHF